MQCGLVDKLITVLGVCSGRVSANETTDFTVKIDATGLRPDTRYYFAFASGQQPAQQSVVSGQQVTQLCRMSC